MNPGGLCIRVAIGLLCLAIMGCDRQSDARRELSEQAPQDGLYTPTRTNESLSDLIDEVTREVRNGDERSLAAVVDEVRSRGNSCIDELMELYREVNGAKSPRDMTSEDRDKQLALSIVLSDYEIPNERWDAGTEKEIVNRLDRFLDAESPWLKLQSASDLSFSSYFVPEATGSKILATVDLLVRAEDPLVRSRAITQLEAAIIRWPVAAVHLVPELTRLLEDPEVQYGAVRCLGELGPAALSAEQKIIALRDSTKQLSIREACEEALVRIRR